LLDISVETRGNFPCRQAAVAAPDVPEFQGFAVEIERKQAFCANIRVAGVARLWMLVSVSSIMATTTTPTISVLIL
jgi:hypothetical protein